MVTRVLVVNGYGPRVMIIGLSVTFQCCGSIDMETKARKESRCHGSQGNIPIDKLSCGSLQRVIIWSVQYM